MTNIASASIASVGRTHGSLFLTVKGDLSPEEQQAEAYHLETKHLNRLPFKVLDKKEESLLSDKVISLITGGTISPDDIKNIVENKNEAFTLAKKIERYMTESQPVDKQSDEYSDSASESSLDEEDLSFKSAPCTRSPSQSSSGRESTTLSVTTPSAAMKPPLGVIFV